MSKHGYICLDKINAYLESLSHSLISTLRIQCFGNFSCCWMREFYLFIQLFSYSFSMKRQSRLSLKRRSQCNEVQGTCNDPIEISDDDSFDLSSSVKKSSKQCTDVTSHRAANISNGMIKLLNVI